MSWVRWALHSINKFNFYWKPLAWRARTAMQLSASSGHPFSDSFLGSDSIWCSLPLTKFSHSLQGSRHSSDHIPITLVTLAFCCHCCCYFCPNSQDVNSLQQPKMSILHHFQIVKLSSPSDVPHCGVSTSSQSTKPHSRHRKGEKNCIETSFRTFSELT